MGTCYFNFNQQQIRELFTFASNAYKYEDMLEWLGKTTGFSSEQLKETPIKSHASAETVDANETCDEQITLDQSRLKKKHALRLLELLGIKDETRTTFIKRCLICNFEMLVEILKDVANICLNNESSEEEDWFSDITRKLLIIATTRDLVTLFQVDQIFDTKNLISSYFDRESDCKLESKELPEIISSIEEAAVLFLWLDLFIFHKCEREADELKIFGEDREASLSIFTLLSLLPADGGNFDTCTLEGKFGKVADWLNKFKSRKASSDLQLESAKRVLGLLRSLKGPLIDSPGSSKTAGVKGTCGKQNALNQNFLKLVNHLAERAYMFKCLIPMCNFILLESDMDGKNIISLPSNEGWGRFAENLLQLMKDILENLEAHPTKCEAKVVELCLTQIIGFLSYFTVPRVKGKDGEDIYKSIYGKKEEIVALLSSLKSEYEDPSCDVKVDLVL